MGFRSSRIVGPVTLAGASAVLNSPAVECAGTAGVYFIVTASNAITPSAAVYEYSHNDGTTWLPAQAAFFATNNEVAAASLTSGRVFYVVPIAALLQAGMPAAHIRLKLTGNAGASPANDILNLTVDAVVVQK